MSEASAVDSAMLGEADREKPLADFDKAWRSGTAPRIESFLPAVAKAGDGNHRRELLEELVAIDLGYRWRLGEQPRLEDYVGHHPALGGLQQLSPKLIGEEYWVRQRWGDRPQHHEYAMRFSQ